MADIAYIWFQMILGMNSKHMDLHLVFSAKHFATNGTWHFVVDFFPMFAQVESRTEYFTTQFTSRSFVNVFQFHMGFKFSQCRKHLATFIANMFSCFFVRAIFFMKLFFLPLGHRWATAGPHSKLIYQNNYS